MIDIKEQSTKDLRQRKIDIFKERVFLVKELLLNNNRRRTDRDNKTIYSDTRKEGVKE